MSGSTKITLGPQGLRPPALDKPAAFFLLGGAQLAVGAAAIFARYALEGAGPVVVSALRLAIAAAIVGTVALLTRPRRLAIAVEVALAGAGLVLAVHFVTWIGSLRYTTVAVATLLVCTTPIWTATYEAIAGRRRPSMGYLIGLGLAAAGLWLLVVGKTSSPPVPGRTLDGEALALVGSLTFGIYLLIVRQVTMSAVGERRIPTMHIVARTYAWATIALAAASLAAHQPPPPPAMASAWLGILAMALVSQLFGHTALNAALRLVPANVVAFTTLLEPVLAAILAALIFRETLSLVATLGGLLVLAAMFVALRDT